MSTLASHVLIVTLVRFRESDVATSEACPSSRFSRFCGVIPCSEVAHTGPLLQQLVLLAVVHHLLVQQHLHALTRVVHVVHRIGEVCGLEQKNVISLHNDE